MEIALDALAWLSGKDAGHPMPEGGESRGEDVGNANRSSEEDGVRQRKRKKSNEREKVAGADYLNDGSVPLERSLPSEQTPAGSEGWRMVRPRYDAERYWIPHWGILDFNSTWTEDALQIFLTPSCRSFKLETERLVLRQVEMEDYEAIRRIKMEPLVQRTQLYGSPSAAEVKHDFQNRYIRSSMPRATRPTHSREGFVFAITAKNPSNIIVVHRDDIKPTNRITSADGYLGNIGLQLESRNETPELSPQKGMIWRQPTLAQFAKAKITGNIYYEIHPQVWGQGIMSEAFGEVLRFAIEEAGCSRIITNPMDKNEASIKICRRNGMRHTRTARDGFYGKRQAFHEITRDEWLARYRQGKQITDVWGGKEVCRWCLNFRMAVPTVRCEGCDWAKYCSEACRRADWVTISGHHGECDHR